MDTHVVWNAGRSCTFVFCGWVKLFSLSLTGARLGGGGGGRVVVGECNFYPSNILCTTIEYGTIGKILSMRNNILWILLIAICLIICDAQYAYC